MSKLRVIDLSMCGVELGGRDLAAILEALPESRGSSSAEVEAHRNYNSGTVGSMEMGEARGEGGVCVLLPTWCLCKRPSSTSLSYHNGPHQVTRQHQSSLPDVDHLTVGLRALSCALRSRQNRLQLLGPGLVIRSDAHLKLLASELCGCRSAAAPVTQIHLIDSYPYRGCLSWSLLVGMSELCSLTIELSPQSRESLDKESLIKVRHGASRV